MLVPCLIIAGLWVAAIAAAVITPKVPGRPSDDELLDLEERAN